MRLDEPRAHASRETLVTNILTFLSGRDPRALDEIGGILRREIDAAGRGALDDLKARLDADNGWVYYGPDPLARRIHHLLAERLLRRDSSLTGLEHARAVEGRPVAIFANHLSYSDANLLEILLHRAGGASLASRLTAIAGPKIFTSRQRRFSSLCFGTVKVPQSADVSSEEAVLTAREVARAAKCSIDAARQRLAAGDALVVFGEGTRSRTGEMQRMLPGVARYLDVPGVAVLPVGIVGTEALFPVGDDEVHPAQVVVRIGAPIDARTIEACASGDRRLIVDAIGLAIAELVPPGHRGVYSDARDLGDAIQVLACARPG
jgi:1-acyl-sn-glycerol-3-phosphate acyltransferase